MSMVLRFNCTANRCRSLVDLCRLRGLSATRKHGLIPAGGKRARGGGRRRRLQRFAMALTHANHGLMTACTPLPTARCAPGMRWPVNHTANRYRSERLRIFRLCRGAENLHHTTRPSKGFLNPQPPIDKGSRPLSPKLFSQVLVDFRANHP